MKRCLPCVVNGVPINEWQKGGGEADEETANLTDEWSARFMFNSWKRVQLASSSLAKTTVFENTVFLFSNKPASLGLNSWKLGHYFPPHFLVNFLHLQEVCQTLSEKIDKF